MHQSSPGPAATVCATTKRKDVRSRLKQKSQSELAVIDVSDYVTIGSFIYALPYVYTFAMAFKPRWENLTLHEVFQREFRHVGLNYWKEELEQGRVFANGIRASLETLWKSHMVVEHVVHRHESRISSDEIVLIHCDDELVAVSKPPSLPVHPCGTYRRNCLQFRIAALFPHLRNLYPVHRLDKETSGVVVFARSRSAAAKFNNRMQAGMLSKRYIAQVHGQVINDESFSIDLSLRWSPADFRAYVDDQGGKVASTAIRVLERRAHTTVVEALPRTGRTHQIRAHLAASGFPIVGDVAYGGEPIPYPGDSDDTATLSTGCELAVKCIREGVELNCRTCPRLGNERVDRSDSVVIHLHAASYTCGDQWAFEAPLPKWARQGPGQ